MKKACPKASAEKIESSVTSNEILRKTKITSQPHNISQRISETGNMYSSTDQLLVYKESEYEKGRQFRRTFHRKKEKNFISPPLFT